MVSPGAVGATQNEIAAFPCEVYAYRAADEVVESDCAVGHRYARGRSAPLDGFPGRIVDCCAAETCGAAGAGVDHAAIRHMWRLCGHYVGACAITGIGKPCLLDATELLQVEIAAATLHVWTVVAAAIDSPFIPVKPQPEQVILNLPGILQLRALRVEVLDAQNPAATATAHREPAHQRRIHIAQVHSSGRRRGEPPHRYRRRASERAAFPSDGMCLPSDCAGFL